MHWIYEVFPEEINKKARQEADDGNEDYATGCNVESDDGDDFYDIIFWIIVSGFSIILQWSNNLFLNKQSLWLT